MTNSATPDNADDEGTGSPDGKQSTDVDLVDRSSNPKKTIGRYEIERQLGKGGFGFVYLAWDPQLLRHVAIKVPRWDKPLADDALERFLKEGQMLAQVEHQAIATVHDVNVTTDGVPYVVMQYIEGRSLRECLQARDWDLGQKLDILVQMAEALQHAHKQGVTHRDLKPANVIIDAQHRVSLVDFGLALHEDLPVRDDEEASALGTPAYMAPEQIRGENHLIDGRTDIWAFGVTMYQMLVGVQPFRGSGFRELLRAICYKNPRPLRQIDERVPRELERICLRCLQKLMDERYQSMADLLEELRAFVAESRGRGQPERLRWHELPSIVELQKVPATAGAPSDGLHASDRSSQSNTAGGNTHQHFHPVAMVPKGLRSFDQNDREFFLTLLPGPVDRFGVPESIRFWLARMGVVDQVEQVPVGLIYGLSGCGKSSFVRAGLLPRLPEQVLPVYVDCTAERLAEYVAERIGRQIHEVPRHQPLAELLRRIRQGHYVRAGDKLLLVLDQFEQWLHRNDDYAKHPLTEALRQCDGDRVQALLLIRDDFWISASQFLKCLEGKIEEGKNAMSLPLFDERHARQVLEALGRAHGALPGEGQALTHAQVRFIRRVVQSLSQRGKIICIHLAVFAEATKGEDWSRLDYRAIGGWEGIGHRYIMGVFNDPQTPSYIRRHSGEAWAILQALLPPSEAVMKGKLARRGELRRRAHLQHQPERFDQLMHFLEFEAHLISPMEEQDALVEETPGDVQRGGDRVLYGLTHDFLVAPIRAWGTAKDNESLRGRSENLLRQLNDQWTLTGDKRFLPSLGDFARIAWFAGRDAKRQARTYWRAAVWHVIVALGSVGLTLIVLAFLAAVMREQAVRKIVAASVDKYLDCAPVEMITHRTFITRHAPAIQAQLMDASQSQVARRRTRALSALLERDPARQEWFDQLVNQIESADPGEFFTFLIPLERHADQLLPRLKSQWTSMKSQLTRVRAAILAAYLNDFTALENVCALARDPAERTTFIFEIVDWRGNLENVLNPLLANCQARNGDLLSALCCSLGVMNRARLSAADIDIGTRFLKEVFVNHAHGGAHYAAMFALEKWNIPLPRADWRRIPNCQWRTLSIRLASRPDRVFEVPLVYVPAGEYPLGTETSSSQDVARSLGFVRSGKVTEGIWMAVFETPGSLVKAFLGDDVPVEAGEEYRKSIAEDNDRMPVTDIDRVWTSQFINWLNAEMGKPMAYAIDEGIIKSGGERHSIRLPTIDEFELALRAGSHTRFFFGDDPALLSHFVGIGVDVSPGRSGEKMPNGYGLFDMLGNNLEWLHECSYGFGALKGGSAISELRHYLSAELLVYPYNANHATGFRLVLMNPDVDEGVR